MPEARRSREAAGWLALVGLLVLPALIWPQGAVLAWLAQTAALVVLALSYNLLPGSTGLLSFCHAAFAGLGAFVAAHAFNRFGFALPWLPLAGGLGGAGFGLLFGAIATRRAGTAFAMITLGLGELIAAAAWSVPDWFGGAGGLAIDRTAGVPLGAWRFGADREAYALIAAWCLLSALAMRVVLATPFARLARAVRDKPRRVAALGTDPRRVRLLMMVIAAFFAGVAGTLTLIDVELASSDSVSMLRSATVLFATVIGGSGGFFGPVLGAAVMAAFGSFVAGLSRAWLFYLGLLFVAVVVAAPGGLLGALAAQAVAWRGAGREARLRQLSRLAAWLVAVLAIVFGVELGYALQLGDGEGGQRLVSIGVWQFDAGSAPGWVIAIALALAATALGRLGRRRPVGGAAAAPKQGMRAAATNDRAMRHPAVSSLAASHPTVSSLTMSGFAVNDPAASRSTEDNPVVSKPAAIDPAAIDSIASDPTESDPASRSSPATGKPAAITFTTPPAALELRGIAKRFGATRVLHGVDLRVEPGERHALIGPNGAGKSTLFELIAGGSRPTRGSIRLHGREIAGRAPYAIARRGLARGFQQTSVFERLSVLDNLRCAAMHAPAQGREPLRWCRDPAALDGAARRTLEAIGLGTRGEVPAGELDYAEQRALDLGIALAGGASVFLFDEPTAGMNREQARGTLALIRAATAGCAVLMIEHDIDAVFDFADRISVLVRGERIATGTPAEIRANAAVRAAYLGTDEGMDDLDNRGDRVGAGDRP
ncbi:branched-chain amino acid ABC transporter ATP-binding protein/permease [Burkholderia gladioli]|uniref:Branched-chain amino acid ABC transporter permease n=1 Tax=Burkholderia gladioli TaxID=28095 RepID=A0A2A7S519_BURGA|nr:branched-chain amino acid ABC transporter ATP-binding protein/permease [Burkholderia gladioli]MBU9422417.1 branched-chain amino acid ABC transporter ATP-binding protein/permease [Burkholderia gladioli]MDN8060210.1 branched-chain amino acid ABC transporter ATP-binding protein/permease [Burkholderia gladioli]PEH38767.1 branched-chain amino acid ABC transporter permease [Burkholderia gladioli]QPQ85154.1 branched-chain amino acid ABC transporter ATP-binding protein/permease [Burkholderia gladiol